MSAVRQAPSGTGASRLAAHLRDRFDARDAVLFDSGTHALTAAIRAALALVGSNCPVALPAFTCYDVATAAVDADVRVLLYDIDPHTLAPDWMSFEAALRAGAGIAVVAPLYGYPVDWECAQLKAEAHGTVLIEDAAQASGGEWRGRPIGSLGDLSVLSFGRGKGWTGAGGGALLNRTPAAITAPPRASLVDEIRTVLLASGQMVLSHPYVYGIPAGMPWLHLGETRYRKPSPARALGEVSASLILATAAAAIRETAARRRVAARLSDDLVGLAGIEPIHVSGDSAAGYLRFPVRVTTAGNRDRVLNDLARHGAAPSYPTPLSALSVVRNRLVDTGGRLPGAHALVRELITLPTHSKARLSLER